MAEIKTNTSCIRDNNNGSSRVIPSAPNPPGDERTESDAVQPRLRLPQSSVKKHFRCENCREEFGATTSFQQVHEHYWSKEHITTSKDNCLYCSGQVYKYRRYTDFERVLIYHSCKSEGRNLAINNN